MLYGNPGDPFYNIWLIAKLAGQNLVKSFGLATPDKIHILLPGQPLIDFQSKLYSHLFSPVGVYNFIIILGFVLTFVAAYLLAGKLVNNKLVRIITALTITFAPYRLDQTQIHISLSSTEWLIFSLYFLISIWQKPSWKNTWWLGIFATLTMLDNYQYGAFLAIAAIVLIAFVLLKNLFAGKLKKDGPFFGFLALSGLFGIALLGIFDSAFILSLIHRTGLTNLGPTRSIDELTTYSAQWKYYLTPSPYLKFLSGPFKDYFHIQATALKTTSEEQTLFLGWLPLLLAAISLFIKKTAKEAALYYFLLVLALVFLLLSFAPTINLFGLAITSPSKFLFDHFPVVRVYARFGYVVAIVTMLLAGFSLERLTKKIKSKNLVILVVGALILLEFWPKTPFPTINVSQIPTIYAELEKQPIGALVEYPFLPADEPTSYVYLNAQLSHHFPLVNFSSPGSAGENLRKSLLNPASPATIVYLKKIGAKYLITHQNLDAQVAQKYPAETNSGKLLAPDPLSTTLVKCDGGDCLYEIR